MLVQDQTVRPLHVFQVSRDTSINTRVYVLAGVGSGVFFLLIVLIVQRRCRGRSRVADSKVWTALSESACRFVYCLPALSASTSMLIRCITVVLLL